MNCGNEELKTYCDQFNVDTYPSLIYFNADKRYHFNLEMNLENFEKFALEKGYQEEGVKTGMIL